MREDILVVQVERVCDNLVDVVVAKQVVKVRVVRNVLDKDGHGLDNLPLDDVPAPRAGGQHPRKNVQKILFAKVVKNALPVGALSSEMARKISTTC